MVVQIRAVDMDGAGLPGMTPIATLERNAFDPPIATGAPSVADGASSLEIPCDKHLYVRMWDPNLQRFANNFYELLPGSGQVSAPMEVVMAPAACFEVTLTGPGGQPAANENIGLMMFHPTEGAWWPAEANTDNHGRVRFASVPPGRYRLKIKALKSGEAEVAEAILPPGAATDLGTVTLE